MIRWKLANPRECLLSLFPAVLFDVPSWRLWAPEDANKEQYTRNELKTKGYDPLRLCVTWDGTSDDVVDPEAKHATSLREDLEYTNETTSNGRRASLSDVDRNEK